MLSEKASTKLNAGGGVIYKLKFSMYDAICICNTQHKFNKILDGCFTDVQCLLKNGQKSDSFAAHF